MQIRFLRLTRYLALTLVASTTVVASAQSQEHSANSISRTKSSRYQSVENVAQTEPAFSKLAGEKPTTQIELQPKLDAPTSPRRLTPMVDSAAFQSNVQQNAPATSNDFVPVKQASQTQFIQPQPVQPIQSTNGSPASGGSYFAIPQADIRSSQPQPTPEASYYEQQPAKDSVSIYQTPRIASNVVSPSNYGNGAISLGSATQFERIPASRNYFSPFNVDESECCDEWAGFCNCKRTIHECACGGLKTNPGHLGLKWLGSKDSCDKTQRCRDRRCQGECD